MTVGVLGGVGTKGGRVGSTSGDEGRGDNEDDDDGRGTRAEERIGERTKGDRGGRVGATGGVRESEEGVCEMRAGVGERGRGRAPGIGPGDERGVPKNSSTLVERESGRGGRRDSQRLAIARRDWKVSEVDAWASRSSREIVWRTGDGERDRDRD